MEGCITFQWGGGGGVFQMRGGFIFKWGGGGCAPWGALALMGGGFRKKSKDREGAPPTMGNPG